MKKIIVLIAVLSLFVAGSAFASGQAPMSVNLKSVSMTAGASGAIFHGYAKTSAVSQNAALAGTQTKTTIDFTRENKSWNCWGANYNKTTMDLDITKTTTYEASTLSAGSTESKAFGAAAGISVFGGYSAAQLGTGCYGCNY